MPFVVEDGTGLSTANSYAAVADADAYHVLYNNTAWAALSSAAKQAALLYATAFIDANYTFGGYLLNQEQSLSFPRSSLYDADRRLMTGVPQKLKNAVFELALVHATTENINETFERGGGVQSERVGPVAVSYFESASAGVSYPFLDKLLASLAIQGSTGMVPIVRS